MARGAAAPSLPSGLTRGRLKQSVRVGAERGGGVVRQTAVAGRDVVVLHIAGGPSLILHPENARELMLAQETSRPVRGAKEEEGLSVCEVTIPARLRWRGEDHAGSARDASRGFLGDVVLAGLDLVTDLVTEQGAELAASEVVRGFDGQVEEGVYALRPDALAKLKGRLVPIPRIPAPPDGGPMLVFVHGTFSDTAGTFGTRWSPSGSPIGSGGLSPSETGTPKSPDSFASGHAIRCLRAS